MSKRTVKAWMVWGDAPFWGGLTSRNFYRRPPAWGAPHRPITITYDDGRKPRKVSGVAK